MATLTITPQTATRFFEGRSLAPLDLSLMIQNVLGVDHETAKRIRRAMWANAQFHIHPEDPTYDYIEFVTLCCD